MEGGFVFWCYNNDKEMLEQDLALRLAAAIEGAPPNPADIGTLSAMARELRRMGGTRVPARTVATVMERHLGAEEAIEYARMAFDAGAISQPEYSAMRDYLIPRYFFPRPAEEARVREAVSRVFGPLRPPSFPPVLAEWRPGQPLEEPPLPKWLRKPGNPGNPGSPQLPSTEVLQRQAKVTEALYILRPVYTVAQAGWTPERILPQLQRAQADIIRMVRYAPYLSPVRDRLLRAGALLTPDRLPQFQAEIKGIMDQLADMIPYLGEERERAIVAEEEQARREAKLRAEFARMQAAPAPAAAVLRARWLPPVSLPRAAPPPAPRKPLPMAGYRGFRRV